MITVYATKGLSGPISYTSDNHLGLVELKPFSYDYAAKRLVRYRNYEDYADYVR